MTLTIIAGGLAAEYDGHLELSPQRLEILLALAGGLSVIERTLTGPPRLPGVGHRYIIASPATGAWAGRENHLTIWVGDAWAFIDPPEGLQAWDDDAAEQVQFASGAWAAMGGGGGGGAPTTADYLVKTADAGLSAERVVTDTSTVAWDWATGGQAKANVPDGSLGSAKLGGDVTTAGKDMLTAADAAAQVALLGITSGVALAHVRKIASLRL